MRTINARATNPTAESLVTTKKRPRQNLLRSFFVGIMGAIGLTAVLAEPAGAVVPGADRSQSAAVVLTCVDFQALADNTVLGVSFTRNSYDFQSLAGLVPFVNDTVDLLGTLVHGVQFDNSGLRVALPAPADTVDVTMGVFHPPGVQILAFDAVGTVVDSAFVPADNIAHTVTLDGAKDITRLRFVGGGDEAIISEICSF